MINKEVFTETHIKNLQNKTKRDPLLLERAIYAFGLLDALATVGLPFIFKGGTSLMLVLDTPRRLSTDIDIVVKPDTDIDEYIQKTAKVFPFVSVNEQIRKGRNDIVKRHFKFTYSSPIKQTAFYILMDVVFEENHYTQLTDRKIANKLLEINSDTHIAVPSADCLLGDKLTAFAPHTTGILINTDKDMEIMKQMYDVCSLFEELSDYETVKENFKQTAIQELAYRGNGNNIDDILTDIFRASASIASRGKICPEDYKYYLNGMRALHGHIFYENFTPELAAIRTPQIMYLGACILADATFQKVTDIDEYRQEKITHEFLLPLSYLRKINMTAYAYVIKADKLL